jgi:hypothetical protein
MNFIKRVLIACSALYSFFVLMASPVDASEWANFSGALQIRYEHKKTEPIASFASMPSNAAAQLPIGCTCDRCLKASALQAVELLQGRLLEV